MKNGTLSPSDEAKLTELGMIVPDRAEEKRAVFSQIDSMNALNSGLNITAVLNLDCNFACLYCFEGNMKGKNLYMSNETADRLIDFVKQQFTDNKKTLRIDFYGGEPLLSTGLIKYISQSLKSFTETRGASYEFTIVTNGSLLTRKTSEELKPLGLKSVQITLDGPADIHNRYRPFKSGNGSFDTIIRNIRDTWDILKIGIGGNFEQNNYHKFLQLLEYLQDEGLTPDKISSVKFAPVTKRPEGVASRTDFNNGCMSINEPWLVQAEGLLRKEILKRGYYTPKPTPMPCMIEIRDAYVVNFDGFIYKCPAFLGKKNFAAGDLKNGVKDYSSAYKLNIWENERCSECVYLPLCFGGCRYMAYVRDGNIDKLDCKKPYLDASLETILKQDITYRSQ
jgi:uncharacterized protein